MNTDIITKYISKSANSKAQRRQRLHSSKSEANRKRIFEQAPMEHKKLKIEFAERPDVTNWNSYPIGGRPIDIVRVKETDMTLEPWYLSEDYIIIAINEVFTDPSFMLCEAALNNPPVRYGIKRSAKEAQERYDFLKANDRTNKDPLLDRMIMSLKQNNISNDDNNNNNVEFYRSSSVISCLSSPHTYEGFLKTIEKQSVNIN